MGTPTKYKALLRRLLNEEDNCDDISHNELQYLKDEGYLQFTYVGDNGLIWRNVTEKGRIFMESKDAANSDKEIEAFDVLWENVLVIDKTVSRLIGLDSLLKESEYNDDKTYKLFRLDEATVNETLERTSVIDKYKPYLINDLYDLFKFYQAVLMRIYLNYAKGMKERNVIKWTHDSINIDRIRDLLGSQFTNEIVSRESGGLSLFSNKMHRMIISDKPQPQNPDVHIKHIENHGNMVQTNYGEMSVNKSEKTVNKGRGNWQSNIITYSLVTLFLTVLGLIIQHYFFPSGL